MLNTAALLFALAAVGGLTMAWMKFSGKAIPLALAIGHGIFAASGLVLLLLHVFATGGGGLLIAAVIFFVLAALGGLFLFSFHMSGRNLPKPLILGHGAIAATGFILLLIALFA